jgi:hypothetical protein
MEVADSYFQRSLQARDVMSSSFRKLMELGGTPVNSQARGFLTKKKGLKKRARKKVPKLGIFEKQALARKREKNLG